MGHTTDSSREATYKDSDGDERTRTDYSTSHTLNRDVRCIARLRVVDLRRPAVRWVGEIGRTHTHSETISTPSERHGSSWDDAERSAIAATLDVLTAHVPLTLPGQRFADEPFGYER